jgi:hypothetical protein
MSVRDFVASAAVVAGGGALAAALFWSLLNVPESNVLALVLSAMLVFAIVITVGLTVGLTVALGADAPFAAAVRRSFAALPAFLVGLLVFAVLWWLTGRADAWWQATRGEIDATFLRYGGTPGTAPLHTAATSMLWFVRWAIGLSLVAALTSTAAARGLASVGRGLRLSFTPWLLGATALGVLLVTQVLWRLAYWRPARLPASNAEILFAGAKLALLYVLFVAAVAAILRLFARAAGRVNEPPAVPRRATTVPA